jgi:L-ascorbate metabolism protein UlaG (beta-lactamase superfamily)
MFDIEYKGGNTVIITSKKTQLVVDPKLSLVGLKDLGVKDGIEVATEERFATNDPNAKLHIEGPGEYEIGDIAVKGIRATRHIDTSADEPISTMYRVEVGDVKIAVLGNIAPKLNEDQLEEIGIVDILIVPVGGNGYTLDSVNAATIARQIEPKVVIPVHYADSSLKYEVSQDDLGLFVKEFTAPVEEAGAKYKVKSPSSIPQVLTVVKLDRS